MAAGPRGALWAESFYLGRFPWDDPGLYQEESPSARAAPVKTPTLITFGERDGPEQGAQIYWSLFWRGVPAELLVFPDEGHIFTRSSHKRTKLLAELTCSASRGRGKQVANFPRKVAKNLSGVATTAQFAILLRPLVAKYLPEIANYLQSVANRPANVAKLQPMVANLRL